MSHLWSEYRKEYMGVKMTQARRRQKQRAIEYKGGKCERCGYDKCPAALDFHHLDPLEKDFSLGKSLRSFESVKAEIDKCVLVCSNCHREIHESEALQLLEKRQERLRSMPKPKKGRPYMDRDRAWYHTAILAAARDRGYYPTDLEEAAVRQLSIPSARPVLVEVQNSATAEVVKGKLAKLPVRRKTYQLVWMLLSDEKTLDANWPVFTASRDHSNDSAVVYYGSFEAADDREAESLLLPITVKYDDGGTVEIHEENWSTSVHQALDRATVVRGRQAEVITANGLKLHPMPQRD